MSLPITADFSGSVDIAGDITVGGDASVTGALDVTGGIDITGPIDAVSVGTNVLRDNSAVTNTAIVMQSNGGTSDYFEVQRADGLRVDRIQASTTNGDLLLNGNGTGIVDVINQLNVTGPIEVYGTPQIQVDQVISYSPNADLLLTANGTGLLAVASGKHIIPQADDTNDIGETASAFRNMFLNQLRINQKANYAQGTNITTAVTITNAESAFQITTQAASAATTATQSFTVNNASVLASSYIFCQLESYSGTPLTNGIPIISINTIAGGSFVVSIHNYGANALSGTFVLKFLVV
jgi:hypothetical protein